MTFVVIAVYAIIAFLEIVSLKKEKRRKEIVLFSCLMVVGLIMSILIMQGIILPHLDRLVQNVLSPFIGK